MLKTFIPPYATILNQGTIDANYKEFGYLRASLVNRCEYCSRAHMVSGKRAGLTPEQVAV